MCTPDSQQNTWNGKCCAYRLIEAASRGGASSMGEVDFEPLKRLPSMSLVRHLEIKSTRHQNKKREKNGRKDCDREEDGKREERKRKRN